MKRPSLPKEYYLLKPGNNDYSKVKGAIDRLFEVYKFKHFDSKEFKCLCPEVEFDEEEDYLFEKIAYYLYDVYSKNNKYINLAEFKKYFLSLLDDAGFFDESF